METIQLFLDVTRSQLNDQWSTVLAEDLKALPSVTQLQIVAPNATNQAQVSFDYNLEEISFETIEKMIESSGTKIETLNVHFPSSFTGVVDAYGASAISILVQENLMKIEGVISGVISERGWLKVELDPSAGNKQRVISEIINTTLSFSDYKKGEEAAE